MNKEIAVVYEHGLIRPLQPFEMQEGEQFYIIVVAHEEPRANGNAAEMLAEIAALPLEGPNDSFTGREHDSILYPQNKD